MDQLLHPPYRWYGLFISCPVLLADRYPGLASLGFFFKVIGVNSLVIYLAYRFIDFGYTSKLLFRWLLYACSRKWHPAFNALGGLAIAWVFLYILYRNKLFVKI